MRVVVTGLVATYPVGGVAWDYLQYVQGFRALGCEVTYLEDTGQWLYDPAAQTFTDDVRANARYLNDALASLDPALARCWSLRAPDGTYHGLDEAAVARACAAADLFLNLSGSSGLPDPDRRPPLAPDAPADRARQLAGAIRARRPVHHGHVVEDRAHAALARRPRVRRQGRRVRALHGPAAAHPRDARGGALRRGAARAHRRRGMAPARRARRDGHPDRLPRLPPRLARRVLDREERVRGTSQRLVLDPHGGLPRVREAGGGAGDRLVRPRAARAGTPRLHHRRGGGCRARGHPRRLRPRLPARARGRRGALPRRGRVRAPPRRRAALGGSPGSHGGCGERSGGARREPRGQMVARSSLLRRAFRHASSVVAALAALAPRLVHLAHRGYSGRRRGAVR